MSVCRVKTKNGEMKWEVRFHLNGRGSPRVRRRFDRKVDADEFVMNELGQARTRKALGVTHDTRDTTFASEAEVWLAGKSPTFSPSHLKRVKGVLSELLPEFGRLKASTVNSAILAHFVTSQKNLGLSNATINRKIEVVRAILNYSYANRRLTVNPAVGYPKLPNEVGEIDFWEVREATEFLGFADAKYPIGSANRWVYAVYLLALNTGMRAGEIWGLRAGDLQKSELILVERQFDRVSKSFRPTKGKKARYVPCNEMLRRELDGISGGNRNETGCTLFRSVTGGPVCHEVFVSTWFKEDTVGAGVRPIRFHDLRHTAITHMVDHRLDVKTVQAIAGHKDISTTMRYVHLVGDRIKQAARTFCISSDSRHDKTSLQLVKSGT